MSEKEWKEIYIPTIGLSNVNNANDEITADFRIENQQTTKVIKLGFVTTRPENEFDISLEITGQHPQVLKTQTVVPDPKNGNLITLDFPDNQSWISGDSLKYRIIDKVSGCLLETAIPLDTITTSIVDKQIAAADFQLYQNYPNPFNPSTVIKYSIKDQSVVSLKVFNTLGQEVKTLVKEVKAPGTYQVNFDAGSLPNGIYLYCLRTKNFIMTKKMILIK